MPSLQSPRGTRDILPADQPLWQTIEQVAICVAEQMGYQAIATPTYEEIGLFQRSIGQGTDVMDKELFIVRGVKTEAGQEEYALRPEGTAGIVRSFIEHGVHTWPQPVKLYSIVNNFRYDRPQKGRYREHTQFDIEYFGDTGPFADVWIIYTTWRMLRALGLEKLSLQLNTLGTAEEREHYVTELRAFLTPKKEQLSEDSKRRLEENPLRILDSKEEQDQRISQEAPQLIDSLGEESKKHFASVQEYLKAWKIPFTVNPRIVRGPDYYSHTTFEWSVEGDTGQQNSLGGGGRYDSLVTALGGPTTGAVGAGMGMDRIMEAMKEQGIAISAKQPHPDFFVVAVDATGRQAASPLIDELFEDDWAVDAVLEKESMGTQLKVAARSGALAALILGEKEVQENTVVVKQLSDGTQTTVSRTDLQTYLREQFLEHSSSCHCRAE